MPTIAVNGIDLYYQLAGEGRRVLFFNGSGSTLESSALLMKPLIDRFEVAAHDQRGLGRTSVPAGAATMADYATDAIGLLDHLGWDSCRVVGISFGGMVAQEFAVTVPDRVERLALVCTSPGGPSTSSYPLHELADLPPDERASISATLLDTRFTPEWLAEHRGDAMLAGMMADRAKVKRTAEQARGEALQLAARAGHDVLDRLGNISSPTLVASGRYDGIAPPANGEAILDGINAGQPGTAELRIYEGGHAFFAQDPKAFPDILNFLDTP
jgi:pimeloyl-ACP methyl ester carboxylesterase